MVGSIAIYARTSPDCPLSAEQQVALLKGTATTRGWTISQVVMDRPTACKKGRDRRSGEDSLLGEIRRGKVQKVLISSIDRVGRSLIELTRFLEICRATRTSIWIEEQRLDSETMNGLSLADLGIMMAHHLRQSRRDQIMRGQAAARGLSIRFGRPPLAEVKKGKVQRLLGGC